VAANLRNPSVMPAGGWSPLLLGSSLALLRQYLPTNADLSTVSQSELDLIALRHNQRPRQTLGFKTPADKLQATLALTP